MAKKPDGTKARKAATPEPIKILIDEREPDRLRALGGSRSDRFNNALIMAMAETGRFPSDQSNEERGQQIFVAITGMRAFKPADEIEGMLAAQAMAMHHASMECSRRAMLADQPFEFAQAFRKAAANASRTYIELIAALDRKHGLGARQVVRVEHVHVHSGGQAIVGHVATGGRGGGGTQQKADGEPHVPEQLAHEPGSGAVIPALLCQDPQRELVSITSDAERPLPVPRRPQQRPANGRGD